MTKKMTLLERQEKLNERKAKAAKSKPAKAAKAKAPKASKAAKPVKAAKNKAAKDTGNIGHNSGVVNEALVAVFTDYEALEANKKEISKAQRDLRAKAKSEFDIQSNVFSDQIRKRKMDSDVRAQFENGVKDLEGMIGYQMSLGLSGPEDEDEDNEMSAQGGDYSRDDAGDDEQLAAGGVH